MADGLLDIGGGVKVVDPQALISPVSSPTNSLKETLGIMDLFGKVQDRPLERRKKIAEAELAENDVLMIKVNNAMKRTQLMNSINSEYREQSKFFIEQTGKAIDLFKINPNLGADALSRIVPGIKVSEDTEKKGAYVAEIGQGNNKKQFLIDPNKITDPEKRRSFEGQERNDFIKNTNTFNVTSKYYRDMLKLKDQATGAADVGILYAFMKILDPNSTVREGEVATAQNTSGVPTNIMNLYNKAISSDGPLFGKDKNSSTRINIINAAKSAFENSLDDTISYGQNTYERTTKQGLDAMNTIVPVGGLKPIDFKPISELSKEEMIDSYQRKLKLLNGEE